MTTIVQGDRGFHLVSPLELVATGVETAASWAASSIREQPDLGWIVARYVEADKPNRNGHIFPLAELKAGYQNVVNKPLNMLHRRHHVIGAFTAAKLLDGAIHKIDDPTPAPAAASEAAAAVTNPHVETLAAVWKYAFPDEYAAIEKSFKEGSAFVSMEAVPQSMTCQACQGNFAYDGPASASYCAHLQASPRAPRALHNAHFIGGGIIIPPTRPGWGQANIRDIAGLIEAEPDTAEQLYDLFAEAAGHLSPATWEQLMAATLLDMRASREVSRDALLSNIGESGPRPVVKPEGSTTHPEVVAPGAHAMGPGGPDSEYGSAMVCFVPPADIAGQLAAATAAIEKAEPPEPAEPDDGDGDEGDEENEELVPVEEMHVTLGYFGILDEGGNVSLDEGDGGDAGDGGDGGDSGDGCSMEAVCAAVAAYAATAGPLSAKVSGAGRFDLGGGNSVIYASVDVPGLPEMRHGLVESLAAAGVPVADNHGFTPHMSLEYSDSDEPTLPKIPSGLVWPVTSIEVWWGDEKHSFDLGG